MFVTKWISTTKIQKISEITNFFRHYFLSRTEVMNPFESEFMQTHHKNGDKTDNRDSYLECLCIKCHSEVDDTHRRNFNTLAYQGLIKEFLYQYGTERLKGKSGELF